MTSYELNSTAKANEALAAIGGTGFGATGIQLLKQLVVAAGVYRGSQFVGPLDAFAADLSGAWSPTQRLLSSWTGDLIELDGSNIITVYDQSGGGNHLTQVNAIHQPVLNPSVAAWSGNPAAVFDGNQFLDLDVPISPASLLMGVHSTAPGPDGIGRYCTAGSGNSSMFELGIQSAFGRWENTDGQVSTLFANPAIGHGLEMWYNAGSSIIRIDTAEEASVATLPLASVHRVGAFAASTQAIIGSITYMVSLDTFYDTSERAAFRAALASVFPFAV